MRVEDFCVIGRKDNGMIIVSRGDEKYQVELWHTEGEKVNQVLALLVPKEVYESYKRIRK